MTPLEVVRSARSLELRVSSFAHQANPRVPQMSPRERAEFLKAIESIEAKVSFLWAIAHENELAARFGEV